MVVGCDDEDMLKNGESSANVRDEIGSMACVFTTGSLHAVNLEELELCPATPTPC
jgi:hypothetical protein